MVEIIVTELNQEYGRLLTVVQPKVIETEEENEFYLAACRSETQEALSSQQLSCKALMSVIQ
jgi:hypothetical protein